MAAWAGVGVCGVNPLLRRPNLRHSGYHGLYDVHDDRVLLELVLVLNAAARWWVLTDLLSIFHNMATKHIERRLVPVEEFTGRGSARAAVAKSAPAGGGFGWRGELVVSCAEAWLAQ